MLRFSRRLEMMSLRQLVIAFVGLALLASAGCTSDIDPDPMDWPDQKEERDPGPKSPSPSPTPAREGDSEQDDRDSYKDIDLEDGDGIPEGSCGPYEAPTTSDEFIDIEQCNPGHEYGVCPLGHKPPDVDKVIVGSSEDDVLEGTPGADLICGMGGNDIIIGNGGEDQIWGGPGNDYIEGGQHGDFLEGGDGDDILIGNNSCLPAQDSRCGPDFITGDGKDADVGDDVLLGGVASFGEDMEAGDGNDLLAPTPLRTGNNYAYAGSGSDVVVTLNFISGRGDQVALEEPDSGVEFRFPLNTACKAEVKIDFEERDEGSMTCSLPWGKKLSNLDTVLPVSASIDTNGEISMDMTLYNNLGNLSVSNYREMLKVQGTLGKDVCVCDPLTDQPEPGVPHDFPAE